MALMPKRVKNRKSQRGRIRGEATRGNRVVFGDFGLQAEQPGWLAAATIEAGRIAAQQYLRTEGRLFVRVFPHKSITSIHGKQFPARLEQPGYGTVEALAAEKGGLMKMVAANPWLFGSLIKSQMGGTPAGAAQLHTTIAPTMLQGSPKENVLPQEAFGLVNYRLAPWDRSADVLARAKAAVGDLPVTFSWERKPV